MKEELFGSVIPNDGPAGENQMKRNKIFIFLLFIISVAEIAAASRIHQEDGILPNHSAEFIRTLNRNASLSADAAFYNPAGLAFMEDGLHVMFSSQTTHVRKEHTMNYYAVKVEGSNDDQFVQTAHTGSPFEHTNMPDKYFAETTSPVMPDIDIILKKDNWAAYFDFSVMQAAPKMHFPYGLAVMDWGHLAEKETSFGENFGNGAEFNGFYRDSTATRDEMYIGLTVGGAYAINNSLSFSGGLRVIKANGNMKLSVTDTMYIMDGVNNYASIEEEWDIDVDSEGTGFGIILGADYKVSDGLNFGIKYEYYAPLELKKTTNHFQVPATIEISGKLDIFKDGTPPGQMPSYGSSNGNGQSELKVTYPQCLSAGASYYILDNLRLESSAEITFRANRDLDGRENDYNMGYKFGTGLEWTINPTLSASMGYLYNNFGIKDDKRDEADFLLPSHSVGSGFGLKLSENTDFSIGAMYMFTEDKGIDILEFTHVTTPTWHAVKKDFKENRYIFAVGITYKFDNIF